MPLPANNRHITLFLCGDVMTGRGIDQILPHPGDPRIHEPYLKSAAGYVELAERINGPIPRPVDFSYVWGAALKELERSSPDMRIVNLETAVTKSRTYWPHKGIHYRMHPANIAVLTAAGIDVVSLANNHVLDWGYAGLEETLETLQAAGVKTAGAGRNRMEAQAPAVVEIAEKGRVWVFALGAESSGIPPEWNASKAGPGVNVLADLADEEVRRIGAAVHAVKRPGDIAVCSIHWGGNWGFAVPEEQRRFARRLIERAGIDVVHGHSSHHVQGIEVYRGKPVLYGCGDFITDYEGISGYEAFRDDLGLMYFAHMDPVNGRLARLIMVPTRLKNFHVQRADRSETLWLLDTLNREGEPLGTGVEMNRDGSLELRWAQQEERTDSRL